MRTHLLLLRSSLSGIRQPNWIRHRYFYWATHVLRQIQYSSHDRTRLIKARRRRQHCRTNLFNALAESCRMSPCVSCERWICLGVCVCDLSVWQSVLCERQPICRRVPHLMGFRCLNPVVRLSIWCVPLMRTRLFARRLQQWPYCVCPPHRLYRKVPRRTHPCREVLPFPDDARFVFIVFYFRLRFFFATKSKTSSCRTDNELTSEAPVNATRQQSKWCSNAVWR